MLLKVTTAALLLALLFHLIEGFEKVIVVTESDCENDLFSDDEDILVTRAISCDNGSCPSLYSALVNLTSNVMINIMTNVKLSSVVLLADLVNISISGHNNPTVNCNNSGGLYFMSCHNCTIEGITWEGCGARNISNDSNVYPVLQLFNSSNITIKNCTFQHSEGQTIVLSEMLGDVNINKCIFLYNKQYEGHGMAVYYYSSHSFPLKFKIANCIFSFNEGTKSITYFGQSPTVSLYMKNLKFLHNAGVPIYLVNQTVYINGNNEFHNNTAENGGCISINNHSTVTFCKSAMVNFTNNTANNYGGAIFLTNHSSILFTEHHLYHDTQTLPMEFLRAMFHNNRAIQGGGIYAMNSSVIFGANAVVMIVDNYAEQKGGAVYSKDSIVTFEGNSTVSFNNNAAHGGGGGAMKIYNHSVIIFKGNSTVKFSNNTAVGHTGGAMNINSHCVVTCEGNSTVIFTSNSALSGGAVHSAQYTVVTFQGNSRVMFNKNSANLQNGGALTLDRYCTVIFGGRSMVTLDGNSANNVGGALRIRYNSVVMFKGNTNVTFKLNMAENDAGVLYITSYSTIAFKENSIVTFSSNSADRDGGVLIIKDNCNVTFEGNSTISFTSNVVHGSAGAMAIYDYSNTTFTGNSTVAFNKNSGTVGGAVILKYTCIVTVEENPTVIFNNNTADFGAALMISETSIVTIAGTSKVTFNMNHADHDGGAVYIINYSTIKFDSNSTITFSSNTADSNGGVACIKSHSDFKSKGNAEVKFYNNKANLGGSLYIATSNTTIEGNSSIEFINNTALQNGGAIYSSDHSNIDIFNTTSVTFYYNTAVDYGGAIYVLPKESSINVNSSYIYFKDNAAGKLQTPVYIKLPKSCNSKCLGNINIAHDRNTLTTSPSKLILYDPAKCINGNDTHCDTYYMNNIMLGQEITFDACVLDYYDQPTEVTQFSITGMNHQHYNISGSKYFPISCDHHATQRISVIGNLYSNNSYNISVSISMYVVGISDSKIISVNLLVELTQCHPGFWFSSESQKCECYNTNNIISCSGSNSTIKRGYWFGSVNGKSTISSCPTTYCNFTCCEITNGIYHLSPVRANQCKQHRSGSACGNCEKGYTLSFDSPECIEVNKCTIGQTILVSALSLLYWTAVVIAVFIMMYFKVTIGSLYAIVYYYSVVDILLSQVLFMSNGLYKTVSIMSSLAKLTPQFLGQLCLVRNMSGIDQQFIHYVHPAVIVLILFIISMLARKSHRISSFVSRGIIHFICFLLLLSYTSIATTSLILMRPLTFTDIDKVYTYLSPDIEYFHGRHLVYGTVAIIFTIVIVIGFPLLLLLEPFLNSKINFIKIKPLLDQFQGCYKDKYRCFASYYMICRLVIILLVIVKISDNLMAQYLLTSSCALMELIHVLVMPYSNTFYNVFDGIILQLVVIISVLPIVQFVDNYDETLFLVIPYLLVILPLTTFITIRLWINKRNIQNAICHFVIKYSRKYNAIPTDDTEELIEANEIDNVADHSIRGNTIIVDV